MRRILPIVLAAFIILAVVLVLAALWVRFDLETPYYGAKSGEVYVEIPRHANAGRIADILVSSGVLRHRLPFIIYIRYTNTGRRIQAGEYRFADAATPKQVAQKLIRGEVSFRSITVPEGLTAHETVELLAQNGLGNPDEMEQLLLRTDLIRDLDPKAKNLEGYLFPETYRFSHKADAEAVIKAMVHQFKTRIARITALYPPRPGWTVRRIVILASMVEKEVKRPEEGPVVASVLMNRLEKRMPLACDATIVYAMKLAGTYEGRLGKADLAMESPYNSYLHPELPPGPIANPGEKSLRAALNPTHTDYLYYVSRNDGSHQFSKDLASHNQAVEKYQRSAAYRPRKGK